MLQKSEQMATCERDEMNDVTTSTVLLTFLPQAATLIKRYTRFQLLALRIVSVPAVAGCGTHWNVPSIEDLVPPGIESIALADKCGILWRVGLIWRLHT